MNKKTWQGKLTKQAILLNFPQQMCVCYENVSMLDDI